MDLLDAMQRTVFLGPEFLTWLWFRAERDDGEFNLNTTEIGPLEVFFDDRLVVGSPLVDAQQNHFKGGQPATSLEARTALRLGKQAAEAKLRIVVGAQEWSFIFKAASFQLASVKLPAVLSKEDDARFAERMFLLEQLDRILRGLYHQFLAVRLDDAWEATELPGIRAWVAAGHEA
ncbi:MAG: hypothetical protein KC549_10945 [Myxococcales bacterium]|nr:hypothetical protein [Myxococcales bacterium]MCB9545714.1 hypothetical protein [Myxococcales bacterium]